MAMTQAEIDALIGKVESGAYTVQDALKEIAASARGKDVREALYGLAYTLNQEGKAGSVDLLARNQIANLITHNNDTDGNSELQDARVGSDGTIYPSAGDAMRQQNVKRKEEIAELKGDLTNLIANINTSADMWSVGRPSSSTGAINQLINNCISTTDLSSDDFIITCLDADNFGCQLFVYNESEFFLGTWYGEDSEVQKYQYDYMFTELDTTIVRALYPNCKIRITLQKRVNNVITTELYDKVVIKYKDVYSKAEIDKKFIVYNEVEKSRFPLYVNGYPIVYEHGGIYKGTNTDSNVYIRTKNYVYLDKGSVITSGYRISLNRYTDDFVFVNSSLANTHKISVSGFYRWYIEVGIDISDVDSYLASTNAIFSPMQTYSESERNAINYAMTQNNPFIVSKTEEKMAHVSNFQFDSDGTLWLAYIGNSITIAESEKEVIGGKAVCYCNVVKLNPYTREEIGRTVFKAGDTIGSYTQIDTVAPYVPYINLIGDKVHVQFWAYEDGELTLAKFDVDKATLEKSNYEHYTLSYGGTAYVLNPTNLRTIYESYSGQSIEAFDHVDMTTHYSYYNGYYYSVINNVFGTSSISQFANQKYRSCLVKSTDCVNWEIVHWYTEIPFTCECCMCIKDGVVYTSDRNNYVSSYNLTSGEVKFVKIPLAHGCKTSIYNYNGKIVLAATIISEYNESVESYRGNLGIYIVNDDLSIELRSRILTHQGIHYPDLGSDGFDLYLSWSEDRRKLERRLQRSNIGFTRIVL